MGTYIYSLGAAIAGMFAIRSMGYDSVAGFAVYAAIYCTIQAITYKSKPD